MVDLARQRRRSRFEARLLVGGAEDSHARHGERKSAVLGDMRGTVVEFGPGTGVNLRYYTADTTVIGIEPNPVMHPYLREEAARRGVDLEIRSMSAASIDVADGAADGVVGTLLLCGVDDPAAVVAEAHRVLRPGGTYFFLEHVVAPEDSATRRVQRVLKRPHRWLFNGCEVDRDAEAVVRNSAFTDVRIHHFDLGRRAGWVRHQLVGTATKPG